MLHPSTRKLIDKLGEMTRKQRVAWIEGEDGSVIHDTEGYRVILTPEPHGVLLTDAVGREIETCTPEEIADETDAHGRPYPQFMHELFREAHRHARGAERAIRILMAGLEAADEREAEPQPSGPDQDTGSQIASIPETLTDETARLDGETAITAAVASLADQINAAPPATQAPAPGPESAPRPASQNTMQQRFSLSGIPYGAGAVPAAPSDDTVRTNETPEPEAGPPPRLVIDATDDLPDFRPEPAETARPADSSTPAPAPAPPSERFNPWD